MRKETAKEMFETLESTFIKRRITAQISLKREIADMKFREDGSLQDYLEQYEARVHEYKASGGKMSDADVVTQLLAPMPDSYQVVTTAIDIAFNDDQKKVTLEYVKNRLSKNRQKSQVAPLVTSTYQPALYFLQ